MPDSGEFRRGSTRRWWTGMVLFTLSVGLLALILLIGLIATDGRGAVAAGPKVPMSAPASDPTGEAEDAEPRSETDGATQGSPTRTSKQADRESDDQKADRKRSKVKPRAAKPSTRKQRMATIDIPADGPKRYRLATTSAKPKGKSGRTITFNVRVQEGLPYDANQVARFMHTVLNDQRSWGRSGDWRLKLVGAGTRADVKAYIATPKTTNELCYPWRTLGKVSCQNGDKVVLNARRWAYGTKSYGDDLIGYRINLVNHEFGHALGLGHVDCPGKGKRAPIMMQQTKGLDGCTANPWPYPGKKKQSNNR